jgi:cell division protein FtsB
VSSNAPSVRSRTRRSSNHLRVVRRNSRKLIMRRGSRRVVPYAVGGAIIVLALIFTVLLEQVVLAQSAFKLAALREELVGAETQHHELLLEAARLENSDRIERFAREELGMVDSNLTTAGYIYADISKDTTVRGGRRVADGGVAGAGSTAGALAGEGLSP